MAILHLSLCLAMCLGLAALAVGLGARLPDLRQSSPAKISANFGGTLNLVLSALYILTSVASVGIPACCWLQARQGQLPNDYLGPLAHGGWIGGGLLVAGALTTLVTVIPLRSGFRHFRNLEV
jgi:ABC-2 type transport system permease protein